MKYQWDQAKARSNLRKHGVDFRDSIEALEDPRRLEQSDDELDYGEDRTLTVGMARRGALFIVTIFKTQDTTRIISARRATTNEEVRYHDQ